MGFRGYEGRGWAVLHGSPGDVASGEHRVVHGYARKPGCWRECGLPDAGRAAAFPEFPLKNLPVLSGLMIMTSD